MPLNSEQEQAIIHTLNNIITKVLYPFRSLVVNSTAVQVKNVPGAIGRINLVNNVASIVYVKFYDQIADPSPGNTAPFLTISVPAGIGFGITQSYVIPDIYMNALWVRCTTGILDTDTTSPATPPIIELRMVN